jgi:hypothetical protein
MEAGMAEPISQNNNKTMIWVAAGVAIALLLVLFLLGGERNRGQPSAPGGPGNAMQNDQGR